MPGGIRTHWEIAPFHGAQSSLFYKSENGAKVGDIYMSLIYTCQWCGANPFAYLQALQRHADRVRQCPSEWLPWNYHEQRADSS